MSDEGLRQADRLAERFATAAIEKVISSPLERTMQTAHAIARPLNLVVEKDAALAEIDFGSWTGLSFEALAADPQWARWNVERSAARPPNGESMVEAQARAVSAVRRLKSEMTREALAVTHGDIIKSIVCFYLGLSLELYERFEIGPGSVSTLVVWDEGGKLMKLNETF